MNKRSTLNNLTNTHICLIYVTLLLSLFSWLSTQCFFLSWLHHYLTLRDFNLNPHASFTFDSSTDTHSQSYWDLYWITHTTIESSFDFHILPLSPPLVYTYYYWVLHWCVHITIESFIDAHTLLLSPPLMHTHYFWVFHWCTHCYWVLNWCMQCQTLTPSHWNLCWHSCTQFH